MIVKAGNGCYLTESYDTPIENRRFEKQVIVSSAEELSMWKERRSLSRTSITRRTALPTCASKTQGCRYTGWARFQQ